MAKFDPDKVLSARLLGTAKRLLHDDATIEDAVSELRALADGRTDILAEAAGINAGAWSMDPRLDGGEALLVSGLLIRAGADPDALGYWVNVGRDNIARHLAVVAKTAEALRNS